jgi:hypothetical protein
MAPSCFHEADVAVPVEPVGRRRRTNDHDGSTGDAHAALPAKPPGLWVVELIVSPSYGLFAARNAFTADVSLAPPP